MKKILTSFIFILCLSLYVNNVNAQQYNETNVSSTVNRIDKEYNNVGQVSKEIYYNNENVMLYSILYYYNGENLTIAKKVEPQTNRVISEYYYTIGSTFAKNTLTDRYDFYYNDNGNLVVVKRVEKPSDRVISEYYYNDEATYEKKTLLTRYDVLYNANNTIYYIQKVNRLNDRIEALYFYNEGATYNNKTLLTRYDYFYNSDNTIAYSTKVNKQNDRVEAQYFYNNGATYNNKTLLTRYDIFYNADNTIYYTAKVNKQNDRVEAQYFYNNGATYSNKTLVTRYDIFYNADNTIYYTNKVDFKNDRVESQYFYNKGATYNNKTLVQRFDYYYGTKNSINVVKEINASNGRVVAEYIHQPKSTFTNKKLDYKYEFFYNTNNTLNYAIKYDYADKQNVMKYIYMASTYYGQGHGDRIKERINLIYSDTLKRPLKNGTVTAVAWYYPSSFGGGWHPGIDLATNTGTPIIAPANGEMLTRNSGLGYGNYMVSVHQVGNDTYTFIYGHMNKQGTKNSFKQGETIGYLGSTGNSTGPHVHVEVFKHTGKTITQVKSKFNSSRDIYFGLGYSSIGTCSTSTVCRLKPQNVFGLQQGEHFRSATISSLSDEIEFTYKGKVQQAYLELSVGSETLYNEDGIELYTEIYNKIKDLKVDNESEQEYKDQLDSLLKQKLDNLNNIIAYEDNAEYLELDSKYNNEISQLIYPEVIESE